MTHNLQIYLGIFLLTVTRIVAADVVIANADVAVSSLSPHALRSIFTMRSSRWPDKQSIHVFVLADKHPTHTSFVKSSLGMFPYQLRMIWDRSVYSGAGYPPILTPSVQEMLLRVQNTPGAIGYIDDSNLPLLSGVKIIEIK